ncbi:MAG: UPF0280 family protein, partial [Armatimonadota bacterium]
MYQARHYRKDLWAEDLVRFEVVSGETDLLIMADADYTQIAQAAVSEVRGDLTRYIERHPDFATSFLPRRAAGHAPEIVRQMCCASQAVDVGPMAAVAGAVAGAVGRRLLETSEQVIIENGGDIFMSTKQDRRVSIYAGTSPLSGKVGVFIPGQSCLGICTSSGTVGHSHSDGCADSAMVVSEDIALADAAATALGNRVQTPDDIEPAFQWIRTIERITHAVVIVGEHFG